MNNIKNIAAYKTFEKNLLNLKKYFSQYKNNYSYTYGKVLCLSYLAVEAEKIFLNPRNNQPVSDMNKIIDQTKNFFVIFVTFSKFQDKNINNKEVNKAFNSYHRNLWHKVWPKYSIDKDLNDLINWRGARIDFNKINQFKNKNLIDFGSGNGSTAFAFLKRNAKHAHLIDFGPENIKASKIYSKRLNLIKKTSFEVADITKYRSKKKYDFVISSAVLHHLKDTKTIIKTLKNIANVCNDGAYFYVYIRGKGGMRDALQDMARSVFHNTDIEIIRKILVDANFSTPKLTHLVDWHKAIYLHHTPLQFENMLKKCGFTSFKRLKSPHKIDYDINQMKTHKHSELKFGSGQLRYLAKFTKKRKKIKF